MKVMDPDGQTWRVSRRWLPWRRSRPTRDDLSLPDPVEIDDPIFGVAFFLVFAVIMLIAPIILVALLVAVEVLALLLLLPFAVLGRVVFSRHWHVELRHGWRAWTEIDAGDWRGSTMKIHEIADAVRRDDVPERTIDVPQPA